MIAKALMEHETLTGSEINHLVSEKNDNGIKKINKNQSSSSIPKSNIKDNSQVLQKI